MIIPFWSRLRNYITSMPYKGKHSETKKGHQIKMVEKRRKQNKVARASRRINRKG